MPMTAIADSRARPGLAPQSMPGDRGAREPMVIETRFGSIEIDRDRLVEIPGGLLGFPHHRRFALTPIPNERLDRFLLLQSVEDLSLSFIVVPLTADAGLVDAEDIREACAAAGTREEDALMVLIVTVRKGTGGVEMTANLRAPVIVDTRRMLARQCVFSNNRYSIRHAL